MSSSADNDPKLQNMSFHVVERFKRGARCKGRKLRVFFNFEIYKLLSPLSSWPPKVVVDIKELKHARCWDTDGNRKWAVFPFNLSSHNHIYIAKYLFFVCRPRLKNALAYNSIGFARTYPMNSDSSAAWIAPSNLWTTRGWWESPLLWVADNLSLVFFAQAHISGCLLSCLNWWQYFLVFGSEKNHVDKLFMKNVYHKWTLQTSIEI